MKKHLFILSLFCLQLTAAVSNKDVQKVEAKHEPKQLSRPQWDAIFSLDYAYQREFEKLLKGQPANFRFIFQQMEDMADTIKDYVYGYSYKDKLRKKREEVHAIIEQLEAQYSLKN